MNQSAASSPSQQVQLQVTGMTCANCALGIEKYLQRSGMEAVSVNFAADEVRFSLVESERLPEMISGIERLGFTVVPEDEEAKVPPVWERMEWLFGFSLFWTLPLLLHMFLSWHVLHNPWVQLALALPVYVVGMYHFGRSAWGSLRSGVPNMDVLIAIGATAAFFYSLYGTLAELGPDFLFYETAASIITLVLLGNLIEHRAVKKTTSAIRDLSQLQPQQAVLVQQTNGATSLREVEIREVRKGNVLQVNTGDRLPVDGKVVKGEGDVDESAISGESLPKGLRLGDSVIGGTVLVSGNVWIEATEVGQGTMLAQIIELVKKAQADKPPIQQLADKISAVFVPVVVGISLLTFLLAWGVFGLSLQVALIQAVAVLVISCPCAMGLATPTAVVVGLGRASKAGILVKGGRTLEQMAEVKQVAFDKTGTLTTGAFRLEKIHAEAAEIPAIQAVILGLEQHSSHPIAQSLTRELEGIAPQILTQVSEIKGLGMRGLDEAGNEYQLGSFRLAQGLTSDHSHQLYLLKNGELWAAIDLGDEIRADAAESIAYLREQGLELILLSGDKQERCEAIAQQLGIQQVYGEQLPQEKVAVIQRLAEQAPTAMIGDGINDAPALAQAQVGISLGGGTEIAMQSAQVVLLGNRLLALKDLHQISQHTVTTIKQNLFWAFFYNVVAIPLAAFGFLQPIIAAAAMAFSDVIVIGNSLRLKIKRLG